MSNESNKDEVVRKIPAELIDDPATAMRSDVNRDKLWELADDIKKNGLINPPTVRPVGERYEVVAGHRRFLACRMIGLLHIPCVVRDVSDEAAFGIMASENLVREDVDPVDEATFIQALITKTKRSAGEVAAMIRRSESYVSDRLAVAAMPDYLREYLRTKQLKLGAALALSQITDDTQRRTWAALAVRDGASVRQAEYWLYQWRMNQLPGAVAEGENLPDATAPEYRPPMFTCAIDGKEYPVQDTTMVTIFKGNLPYLVEMRKALAASTDEAVVESVLEPMSTSL